MQARKALNSGSRGAGLTEFGVIDSVDPLNRRPCELYLFSAPAGRSAILLAALARAFQAIPVSRKRVRGWFRGGLSDAEVPWPDADAAISLGPLDAFAAWLKRQPDAPLRRMIALSSMSAESKQDSTMRTNASVGASLRASEDTL